MFRTLFRRLSHRRRGHLIGADESIKSARRRAFDLFDQGMRPTQAAPLVGMSPRTAYRYFQQWKKQPRYLEITYNVLRAALHGGSMPAEQFIQALAAMLRVPPEQILEELERPWGLKRLLAGKARALEKAGIQRKALARLDAALELVHLYEARGIAPERVMEELDRLKDRGKASGRPMAPYDTEQAG